MANDAHYRDTAFQYTLAYARSIPAASSSAEVAVLEAIVSALKLPSLFEFDSLFGLEGISRVQENPLYSLLEVFATKGISEYRTWAIANSSTLESQGEEETEYRRPSVLTVFVCAFSQDLSALNWNIKSNS